MRIEKEKTCIDCGKQYMGATTSKRCLDCWAIKEREDYKEGGKVKRAKTLQKTKEKDHCLFCGSKEKLHIHHIDKNHKNNKISNLAILCSACHKKIHGRIYNPLFATIFPTLVGLRLSYNEIGQMFGMTRQNVYNILKK